MDSERDIKDKKWIKALFYDSMLKGLSHSSIYTVYTLDQKY